MLIYITLCRLYLANKWNAYINSQNDIMKSIKNLMTYKKKNPLIFCYEKTRSLPLILEYLVRILRIDDNKVVVIYFRMLHTRQRARTEPPFIERRSRGRNASDWEDEDPLDDTTSHAPVRSSELVWGRAVGIEEE